MRSLLGALLAAQLASAPAFAQETLVEPVETPRAYRLSTSNDVKVHLDANFRDAGIEPAEFGAARCLAPCDRSFPRDGAYRITGDGLIPSEVFRLPARPNEVTLDVQASMKAQETTGAVMGVGGLVLTGLGIVYGLDILIPGTVGGSAPTRTQEGVAIGGFVGGLALTAVGALLYLTAGTRVRSTGVPLPAGPSIQ
jgi:hypothetical protein